MPLVLLALALLLAGAPPARAGDWARPVAGEVVEAFDYDRAAPFARGRHRGVDLAARMGEAVRAPCPGVVTFAGRVPSRGAGVSIRCGALVATLVELGRVHVGRGERVGRGARVGASRSSGVHLGARRAGEAFAYVDPMTLLGRRPPLGPAPPARRGPRATPRPAPARRAAPTPRRTAAPTTTPVWAWVGFGFVIASIASAARWPSTSRRRSSTSMRRRTSAMRTRRSRPT